MEEEKGQQEEPRKMKECFGISMGWFMEDLVGDHEDRERCYHCADFEACYKMCHIRCLTQMRFEIRRAGRSLGLAFGGSHSTNPF